MLSWGWPLFANSIGNEGGPVAAATPQLVGPATAGRLLPPDNPRLRRFPLPSVRAALAFSEEAIPSLSAQG